MSKHTSRAKRFAEVLFGPPMDAYERESLTQTLNVVLWALLGIWTVVIIVHMMISGLSFVSKTAIILLAILAVALWLVRRGHLMLPRLLVPTLMVSVVTMLAFNGHGLHDTIMAAFPVATLLGALFLGRKGILIFSGVALIAIVSLYFREKAGNFSFVSNPDHPDIILIDLSIILFVAVALLWTIIAMMAKSIERARRGEVLAAEAYSKLADAQYMARIGSWELELGTGRFSWSDGLRRIFEWDTNNSRQSVEMFFESLHPDDQAAVRAIHQGLLVAGAPCDLQFRISMEDDGVKFVQEHCEVRTDSEGRPIRVVGTLQDITEQKRSEEALISSEERYRSLFNEAPDAILILEDGHIIRCNPKALELFQCTEGQLLGSSPYDFSPSVQADGQTTYDKAQTLKAIVKTGETQCLEWLALRNDGSTFLVEVTLSAMKIQDQWLIQAILRDITERKNKEEERISLETRLTQAQKMEAVGRLAGGVAHDFNNLLTGILGYADIALTERDLAPRLSDCLNEIYKAGLRARDLTRQLLAFGRKQTLEVRLVDINEIVTGFGTMLRRLIGEDIEIVTRLAPNLRRTTADPTQMEQVLLNLAINARDAMPSGGTLTIQTANRQLTASNSQEIEDVVPGAYIMLAVSDTGCGMDTETAKMIFEPFFTTKESGKGTGLGLATVYGIVRQHGGYITVRSAFGQGATFSLYLPRSVEMPDERIETTLELSPARGSETVLLVEDDELVRSLTLDLLTELGYHVIEVGDSSQAESIAAQHKVIHLLLTDVIMPGLSGPQVYQLVSSVHPSVRVLYMSGYSGDVIANHGILEEGIHFLQKPFDTMTFARKIRETFGD